MSERSDELRRQRGLLREHLAWIEREIAAEDQSQAAESGGAGEPPVIARPIFPRASLPDDRDAEAILADFRQSSPSIESEAKRGCILYFSLIIALFLALSLAFLYFYSRSRAGR